MRRLVVCFLAITSCVALSAASASARTRFATWDNPVAQTAAAPASGARAEFLERLDHYEKRFTDLAQAVPAEKYTWRPAEGVRSVSEAYLHVCAANFNLPRLLGTQPPTGIDVRSLEKSTTDKAKVIQMLKDSFAHVRGAVLKLDNGDVEKTVKLLGSDRTYRYVFFFILGHLGEHLGQSIAYARANGVVPPWTEEFLRQPQAKPADKPKP